MLKKRISRLYAIQILYQLNFVNENVESAVETFLKYYQDQSFSKADHNLVRVLVLSASKNEQEVKNLVSKHLTNYSWENLELLISLIFRTAIAEMELNSALDTKVIISEYMTIASTFFEDRKITIINPVLEKVANEIRPGQIINKSE